MRLTNPRQVWRQCQSAAASIVAIALVTFASYKLHFNSATVVLLYLLVVVLESLAGSAVASLIVAVVAAACLDFFFLPPVFTFRIADPFNVLALFAFLIIALVVMWLVLRVRVEAGRARRRGTEMEQLYEVARRLLVVTPDQVCGVPALKVFRDVLGVAAVCLFDADTAELGIDGVSQYDLAERTRQAYILGKDTDDAYRGVFVRCLRVGSATTGAIGFEGLLDPEMISPASVLAAAALERARAFRRASYETAAAHAEDFRAAILDALAHEFKTPLATILAVIGGIRESKLEPAQVEMAGMIELEASRLSGLTSRLLRVARLDREEVQPRLRTTDIPALVEGVVRRHAAQFRDRQVAVSCQCQSGQAPADPELLDLALTQLLDNAFKYSLPGSAVTVEIGPEDEYIMVRVRNEGSSIAPHEQERIFERFYRGTDARKLVSGAGLGLHVARKIALAHGGSLVLDKSTPTGTVVFCLKLPRLEEKSRGTQSRPADQSLRAAGRGSALPDGSHHVPTDN
jgi:two-component system sensor histidine kinase KdpD